MSDKSLNTCLNPFKHELLGRPIAGQLNRHHLTIARELKRNTKETYLAELVEELADQRRKP